MTDTAMLSAITEMLSGPPSGVMIIMAIGAAARAHGLDSPMYYRQIWAESRFNPEAINPKTGCLGLGQMNPKYWPEATTDVEDNLELSAAYMAELLERYGEYSIALAAYNWGLANVNEALGVYGYIPWDAMPKETQRYIRWIMKGGDGNE